MTYKARFVHGSRSFNLDSGAYDLFQDFIFPVSEESLNMGAPAARSMTGGEVVSKTAQDRWWAWSVRIMGSGGTHTHQAAGRLSAWLNNALADKTSKLYFEYIPNYVVPAPIWGQYGQPYRWEVKAAIVDIDGGYYHYTIPDATLIVPISLLVGPYALGARQLLCQAKGAVLEDSADTLDGTSRGVMTLAAHTNKMTNPVFGNALTDWTAGANVRAEVSTDADFVLYGASSAKLSATDTTLRTFTQTINVGNTNTYVLSAFIKKADGSAVTASDVALYYNGAVTIDGIVPFGKGWYRIWGDLTGIASDQAVGVYPLVLGVPIYVDGVQLQDSAFPTAFIYGEMLGCSWAGTAHASTSTSTAGMLRLPLDESNLTTTSGTVRVVLMMNGSSASYSASRYVFSMNTTAFLLYWDGTNSRWRISDGTNYASAEASTWTANDIFVFHVVYGTAGLKLYANGASVATNATYLPFARGTLLYIGTDTSIANRIPATFLGFEIFKDEFTAAQVTADYAQIHAHIDGGDGYGQRLSSIPYLWTKDGDNQVDNCNDNTYDNYAIANGIQGSTEAETEIQGTLGTEYKTVYLSNLATRNFILPSAQTTCLQVNMSGTADAACSGGACYTDTVGATGAAMGTYDIAQIFDINKFPEVIGMQFISLLRAKDTTAAYLRYAVQSYLGLGYSQTEYNRPYATTTAWRLYASNTGMFPRAERVLTPTANMYTQIYGYKNTGTSLLEDYYAIFPRPVVTLNYVATMSNFILYGDKFAAYEVSTSPSVVKNITGDVLELVPNKYNLLQSLMGDESNDPVISSTLTYTIYYTPRYLLI